MKTLDYHRAIIVIVAAAFLGACASDTDKTTGQIRAAASKSKPTAIAVLSPAPNGQVKGQVTFVQEDEGVRVTANIEGLTPGKHGFHIHEKGDCSAPDFSSAGGHFNPGHTQHGAPTDPMHHGGDFGNIEANDQGVARFERVFNWLSMSGTNSILNHAVIVHDKPDDLKTQPTGNAGGRVACGVIQSSSGAGR